MVLTAIGPALIRYEINTARRVAAFVGQCAHESALFTATTENLNYSAKALRANFSKYFTNDAIAAEYARQPERIAGRVYSGRLGNGNVDSGDAWRFRGHSYIQLTGRNNITAFALAHKVTIDAALTYLKTSEGAFMGAGWFWATNRLNALADGWEITKISRTVNGGNNGLAERIKFSNALLKALEGRS